eukprot:4302283-Amphidinium_carterae.2
MMLMMKLLYVDVMVSRTSCLLYKQTPAYFSTDNNSDEFKTVSIGHEPNQHVGLKMEAFIVRVQLDAALINT